MKPVLGLILSLASDESAPILSSTSAVQVLANRGMRSILLALSRGSRPSVQELGAMATWARNMQSSMTLMEQHPTGPCETSFVLQTDTMRSHPSREPLPSGDPALCTLQPTFIPGFGMTIPNESSNGMEWFGDSMLFDTTSPEVPVFFGQEPITGECSGSGDLEEPSWAD